MKYKISKIVLLKTLLLTVGLGFIVILSLRVLNKLNTQRQPDVTAENGQQSIPIRSEIARAASARASQLKSNPDLQQSSLNVRVTAPIQSTMLAKPVTVSVKDFGAIGNGIADDTSAIQKAIDAVDGSGGGILFFPTGIYKVSINPGSLQAITIRPKVILSGSGHHNSIIKLADRQGNYSAILAGEKPKTDLSDFGMYNIAIDGNGTANPVSSESELEGNTKHRYALRIFAGKRIHIAGCRFTSLNNVNAISVNGELLVSDVEIKNNIFELIGGGSVDYDHSTIYSHAKKVRISHNYFSSRDGAGTPGARTAIEIHGDDQIVDNNIIHGFTNGIYVTGFAISSNNQTIAHNIIKEANTGIAIWSYFYKTNTTNPAIGNCTISHNQISLNINDWRKLGGDTSSAGIWLEPRSDAPIENLNILNNQIYFSNFSGNGSGGDNLANGIKLWRYKFPKVVTKNLRILGNTIENSLGGGIYISMPIVGGEISHNTILNPGRSSGSFNDYYRAAIIVDGLFDRVKVNDNSLVDNQTANTMKAGIIWESNCVANCEVKRNSLQVASGDTLQLFRSKSSSNNHNVNFLP
ncbi:glycosyl hydrolase family 28-related protein [Microcoleus sp. T2B6]|uniref:glycosyl hydrolase family 28-related protein n=1 Tax=Microcoleus sp. T2B6 TaxID=3055424 RepID=UPI002FD351B4